MNLMSNQLPLALKAKIAEYHINHPDTPQHAVAIKLNVSISNVQQALNKFYRRPKNNLTLQSDIDSDRAIYLASKITLRKKVGRQFTTVNV